MTSNQPRVVVVGCGAIGGVFAGTLASSGSVDVTVIEVSEATRTAVLANGLRLTGPDGDEATIPIDIRPSVDGISAPDLILFFVKSVHNASAAASVASIVGDRTIVATVQNGMGHGEVFSTLVPADRLVVGVTTEGANALGPGNVVHYISGMTRLGPWKDGDSLESATRVADILDRGGLRAIADAGSRTAIWSKLVINSAYNGVSALTGLSMKGVGDVPEVWQLCADLVTESVSVAQADGVDVSADDALAVARRLYENASSGGTVEGKASMVLDVEAHRPTEIDAINGAVARTGSRLGVPTPLNSAVVALVKGVEHSWVIGSTG